MTNSFDRLVSLGEACKMLGVFSHTLRRYPKELLPEFRTPKGHRRYRVSDIEKLQGKEITISPNKVAVYVRVSSQDQKNKGDLERQKGRVLSYCINKKYEVLEVLEEVGSGLNDNRKKLYKLLGLVTENKINKVVVEHKDRLTRFNFKIYEIFFKAHNVEIEVIETELNKSFEEELVGDIIGLMTSFSARLYGKRGSRNENNKK